MRQRAMVALFLAGYARQKAETVVHVGSKGRCVGRDDCDSKVLDVGRNERCPCGRRRKFKKCCLSKVPRGRSYQRIAPNG